jgi:hypothetical protein
MAQFFGRRSRFIIFMQKINYTAVVIMWIFLAYLVYGYFGQIFKMKAYSVLSVVILSTLYFSMAYWIIREKHRYKREGDNFKQGGKGEGAIYYELLKLPDTYLVFQDVKFPARDNNIDFVVVGSPGIFAIEVKSHKGLIGFNGVELMKDGRPFEEGDPLKQTMQEALQLNAYILEQTGADYFVFPLLVFSSSRADVRFGFKPIKNVHVIKKGYLIEMITNSKPKLSEDEIEKLEIELSKLVYPNRLAKTKVI